MRSSIISNGPDRRCAKPRFLAAVVWGITFCTIVSAQLPKPEFNEDGQLLRPDVSYREWVYIGTPLTPNDLNPPEASFPDFHNVYIHPDDFDAYRRTGRFPDGTVLVKELVSVGSKQAVSGAGYFMGEFTGLEATIKDSKRFADEPGYWAYFSFGHSYPLADAAEAFPAAICNACHEASAADDWVFTQYYPVLRAAKGESSGRTLTNESAEYEAISSRMLAASGVTTSSTADTVALRGGIPMDMEGLFTYLGRGAYRQFPAQESAQHPSRGPHTKFGLPVRVYLNETLNASLAAENDVHPVGSQAVKEMFDASGDLQGWAVMQKTQADSAGGKGWFWYEIVSTTDGSSPVAIGNGVPSCFGCHALGDDYVLTGYPLK